MTQSELVFSLPLPPPPPRNPLITQNAIKPRNKARAEPTSKTTAIKKPVAPNQRTSKSREEAHHERTKKNPAAPSQRSTRPPMEAREGIIKKNLPATENSQPLKETANIKPSPRTQPAFGIKKQVLAPAPSVFKAVPAKIRQVKGKFLPTKKDAGVETRIEQ
jgi:hypothetical protein